jgi:predicted ATP-grasp superfamily ATP-dependent carboligase
LLLVAQSARMLSASALRCGIRAQVADLFGDMDTREYADQLQLLKSLDDEAELLAACELLASTSALCGLVYGSGMDGRPDLLDALSRGRTLWGNTSDCLRQVADPREFFTLLDRCQIPHPEVRYTPPSDPRGWLFKHACGEGGKRVGFCAQEIPADPGFYYQRLQAGKSASVLFLADGRRSRILGFNRQYCVGPGGPLPFLFRGVLNRLPMKNVQRQTIRGAVARLTQCLGLRGLNSLDFIADRNHVAILELNPRPSASMALYDADVSGGLLQAHVRACLGELNPSGSLYSKPRGLKLVYAKQDLRIPGDLPWPKEVADRPGEGALIKIGHPLCTLQAEAKTSFLVKTRLFVLEKEIQNLVSSRIISF